MNSPIRPEKQWYPLAPSDDDADFIDLKKKWQAVWAVKWSIIALAILVTSLAALALSQVQPIYRASATIMVEAKGNQLVAFQQVYDSTGLLSEYIQTQIGLITSRDVAERVIQRLNLTQHPAFDPRQQPKPLIDIKPLINRTRLAIFGEDPDTIQDILTEEEIMDFAVRQFMERTTVSVEGKSQLIRISFDMTDRFTAALAANTIADSYIESQLEAQMDMSIKATTWMNSRLEELRGSLKEAENRLQDYREQEGLVDIDGVATISSNELAMIGDRMIDARRQRAEAESQYRQVQSMSSQGWERMASVPAVLGHPLIQQFKAEQARAQAKVDELSGRYGERFPAMQAARSDLNAATASLQSQVEQVVAGIERNYQLALANENSLRSSFNQNKEQIQDISGKEFQIRELTRDVESNRALYETFMTRLQETTATQDLNTTNARIVDQATPPSLPAAPNKKLLLTIAAALSLIAGVVIALISEILNNTFKSADDVEGQLNLPVLGIMPLMPKKHQKAIPHLFEKGEEHQFCEAVRTIRTGIMLADMTRAQKVLVVTSSVPGEGKSALATNLAFALSQLKTVLLIDADLRRPTIARNFDFPVGTPGLANLIAGTAKAQDCIQKVSGHLDMMTAGAVPPNPLELLASPRFAELLEKVKEHYDHIIIDSPPTQAVSDPILTSTLASSVIYVVKSESTSIPMAQRGVGQLLQSGASIVGVVLNQVDVKKAAKKGEYSGYIDHYGYSSGKA
ncbi:polysaccharide biosynthesis tyrosine autokinase [Halopseudomonas pelagia]|uniref:GumC family protein n=1 Tax=Halopseudomonas pelagia TaxID=553151 RepID=UPI0030DA0F2E|tara:strand:+ start:61341 stop:63566 length:2226 start_codon:yes stop_codon:yes gene_type:complete